MDLDDRIVFVTPEGVELEVQLAGLGSRFIAGLVDLAIQALLIGILVAVAAAAGDSGSPLLIVSVIGGFAIWYLYFVPFEVLGAGRSPGKRLGHLRVVRTSGAPVDLTASLIRNLLRLIDGITVLYVPSIVAVAASARNQRPGDMAAGTVVIRDRPGGRGLPSRRRAGTGAPDGATAAAAGRTPAWVSAAARAAASAEARWDTSAVTPQEAAAVRRFLSRRRGLATDSRRELALRLAGGLRPKVTGAPDGLGPEAFLEQLSARLGERGPRPGPGRG